jgi:hypothetical protein
MSRTDIHRPGSPDFDPQAYQLVDVYDLATTDPREYQDLNEAIADLARDGIVQAPHARGCGHCGQTNVRYAALLFRSDVHEWIFVGQDCLEGRFSGITKEKFAQLRKDAELARAKQAVKAAWLAFCADNPAMAYASYADNIEITLEREAKHELGVDGFDAVRFAGLNWNFATLADIARKSRQYGSASDKQMQLVERLVSEQDAKWASFVEKQRARGQEPAKGPIPAAGQRHLIEGVVVAQKSVETPYGTAFKMLVALDNGARLWGTEPSSLSEVAKGDRVRFVAKVEASKDDASFGFYSRPTKAEIVHPFSAAA